MKKYFRGPEAICKVEKKDLDKGLSKRKRALLGVLIKMTSEDSKYVEDPRNFPGAPGVITCVRDTGSYVRVWTHMKPRTLS